MVRRLVTLVLFAVSGLLLMSPVAGAAPCGSQTGAESEPLEGALLFKSEPSTTALDFGASSSQKRMIFVFEVSNCRLVSAEGITAKVHASEGEEAFGEPEIEADDSQLTVEVPVDPEKFDAGKHTAAITVNGATITGATTKVNFQSTEDWPLPTILWIICALLAIGAAVMVKVVAPDEKVKVKPLRLVTAIGLGLFASGAVWKAGYVDAEIWQPSLSTLLALVVGTVTAAFGAASGALVGKAVVPKT
jgi:hypothetical protein